MTFLFYLSIFFFMLLCGVLSLVILIQESKSLGLGASFGGDAGESIFGTSTADVLKKLTAWLAFTFMIACVLLSIWSTALGENRIETLPPTLEEYQK